MKVTVRLFAILRQRAGRDTLELDLPEGARVSDALAAVDDLAGGLRLVMAVNREYAAADHPLAPGDELALIPPVSGGATTAPHVAIRAEPLSADAVVARVRDPRAGAVVVFEGVTRDVGWLDYEAYAEMALEQMQGIVAAAIGVLAVDRDHAGPRSEWADGRIAHRGKQLGDRGALGQLDLDAVGARALAQACEETDGDEHETSMVGDPADYH